ncbi:MAG: non-canonical purine NTP diphosphatase [Flammeovirgaceae bacterium]
MLSICFATNNLHKIKEISEVLKGRIHLLSLKDVKCFEELPETTNTIEGNSHQKAEYVWKNYHVDCFADDSGLEIEALHGQPGVHSAYYAGEQRNDDDNINLVLKKLENQTNRKARFRTVITLYWQGKPYQFEGVVHGNILLEKRGTNGFGYDPIFQPVGYDKTYAEMSAEEKNKISHRAIATQKLVEFLNNI